MARKSRGSTAHGWRNFWYGLLATFIAAIGIAVLFAVPYLMSLDKEIQTRFAGVRWTLPAQVYAAPLELYPGLRLDAGDLKHELERLGYRGLPRMSGPGTFSLTQDRAEVHVRAFDFWDSPQDEQLIRVSWGGDSISSIESLDSGSTTALVRFDPLLIGSIYPQQQGEDRVLVRLDEVPDLVKKGLLAVEDQDFYDHFGISLKGIARAMLVNLRAGHTVQGASTITQQLVRNFFLTLDRTWTRKLNEVAMSVLLESHYSKDEILEAYINEIHLGQDGNRAVHGFGLGSQFYFNKPISELESHEAALLIGLIKGPSFYNPRRNPERALTRRNLVLSVFLEQGLIDEQEYQSAIKRPLGLSGNGVGGVERFPAFVDLVKRQLRKQYPEDELTEEGLRIFTTLDPRAQEVLERNVREGVADLEKSRKLKEGTLEAAGVVTSVNRGDVIALVGGRQTRFAGFNRAIDARRSIGSLVKPFVYLTALKEADRYNLHTILEDEPIELTLPTKQVWAPKNYDKKLHGPTPLYIALAHSYNLPNVRVGLELGVKEVIQTLHDAGYTGDAKPLPSVLLGAVDISPVEVAQMYGTLAAGGFRSAQSAIREVTSKDGKPLNRYPIQVKQTLPEGPVYLVDWAMNKVMTLGTGRSALSVVPDAGAMAGKSGTTDDLRDSWFAGFGAERVTVIWLGRDDYQPMGFTGSSGALQIWSRVMRDLKVAGADPVPPPDVVEQLTDPATGLKADEGCQSTVLVPYLSGYAPTEFAPCANASQSQPLQWLRDIFE
jgi:penicillin-binding protein 1B